MNPVPRPMVLTAGIALAGVCVLGLYLGIQPSLERAGGDDETPASSAAPTPGIGTAVQAVPLKTDLPPPSAAPAASSTATQLAQAGKTKRSDQDSVPASDAAAPTAQPSRQPNVPEPPTLYSPDEPPAPAPAGGNNANTPPY